MSLPHRPKLNLGAHHHSPPAPTIVLVPGHWHTLAHLKPLTAALSNNTPSLPTLPLQLHTVGRKPKGAPRPSFSDDVSVIYAAVARELLEGRDVCLVLHSYAGMPGAEAVNCLVNDGVVDAAGDEEEGVNSKAKAEAEGSQRRGKLVRVVFIAAYIFPAKLHIDPKDFVGKENPGFSIDNNNMTHMTSPWHFFFNDLPLSAAKPFVDACSETYYVGPMHLTSEKWRRAPITALLCRKDNAIPVKKQEQMWKWLTEQEEQAKRDEEEEEFDADDVEWSVEFGERERGGSSNGHGVGDGKKEETKEAVVKRNGLEYIDACHTPWVSRAQEVADFLTRVLGREDVTQWMSRDVVRGAG